MPVSYHWISIDRRDSEGQTSDFRKSVLQRMGVVDLQGLLIGDNGEFTQALEAFDVMYDELGIPLIRLLPERDAYIKAKLASALSIPFSIWARRRDQNPPIQFTRIGVGEHAMEVVELDSGSCTEAAFIKWWKRNKKTDQTKTFYERHIEKSYFDNLLGQQGLAWGGNVDGILYDYSNDRIQAIIEIRSNSIESSLRDYDPARYYAGTKRKPAGDYNTWQPVIKLAKMIGVPLILLTFHKDYAGKDLQFGVATIEGQTESRLLYRDKKTPGNNLMDRTELVIEYIGRQKPPTIEHKRYE